MALQNAQPDPTRRGLLKAGAGLLAIAVMPSGLVVGNAWAQMPRATKPETFATLVQMSRDCYPHAQIEDKFYAAAVDILDQASRSSEEELALLEDSVAELDRKARDKSGLRYGDITSDDDRTAILESMQSEPFFQKVRSNLVVGLYNQKELWPIFGYEGASADLGGYIDRGFDDIDWV